MAERLDDANDKKWEHHAHTRTKHRILARYLKGWIAILARAGLGASQWLVRLMLIDGFAGRGRYVGGEAGSPMIIADVADQLIRFLGPQANQVALDCAFIESNDQNHQILVQETERVRVHMPASVTLRDPIHQPFEQAIRQLLVDAGRRQGLFVFVDPFGYGDTPLQVMKDILAVPRGEVFVTFMVEYVNRFLTDTDKEQAYASLFGVPASQLPAVRQAILSAPNREIALRDYYMERLRQDAGAKYVWAFRMMGETGDTTLYYLIHASTHPKALRLMKSTMKRYGTQGEYAFFGRTDFARQQRLMLIAPDDPETLKDRVTQDYAGQSLAYEELLNLVCDKDEYYYYADEELHEGLKALRAEGRVDITPVTSKTARGLRGLDRIDFPAPPRPRVQAPPAPPRTSHSMPKQLSLF